MDLSSAPPTNMAASNTSAYGAPPQLGAPVPGTTGGMPAQSGLSVMKNPMAQQLESRGRNGDTMLVHMTPDEVGGLQNLAMAMGGSLTINPHTGLPEANFLKKLLPTLLGAGLSFIPGVGPLLAAGIVGGGQTLLTGDIGKGLTAGLQAFGGASLSGALAPAAAAKVAAPNIVAGGAAGALPTGATSLAGLPAGLGVGGGSLVGGAGGLGAGIGSSLGGAAGSLGAGLTGGAASVGSGLANATGSLLGGAAGSLTAPASAIASSFAPQAGAAAAGQAAKTGLAGFAQRFGQQASAGLGKGMLAKAAPYIAGGSVLDAVSQASMPSMVGPQDENKSVYEGPYRPMPRKLQPRRLTPEGEIQFFDVVNPYPGYLTKEGNLPRGYAEGGDVERGLGARLLASLPDTIKSFQTSPGAITASRNYPEASTRAVGETDFGIKKLPAAGAGAGTTSGGASGGVGDGGLPAILANASGNGQMGGTSTPNFVEGFQHQMNQRDGTFGNVPPPNMNLNPQLPGYNIDAAKVSGQGMMPNFKIEDVRVEPIRNPNVGFSDGLNGTGGGGGGSGFNDMGRGLGGFDAFNQYNPFGGSGGAGSVGAGLDSRIGGGNYNFLDQDFDKYFASGGNVDMDNGSFVVDARTVSELGNGSSNAGIEHLARMGGRPVRGGGDGVSDSVPARIGGSQEARVARDEVVFPAKAVAKLGGGDHKRGTQKLYALMEKAHKARKQAKRGQDTKVAKGLGALS